MKNKIFTTAFTIAAAAVLFISCDMISGGIALNSADSGEKLREKIEKHIDPEATVYAFIVNTDDEFSFKTLAAVVYYTEPGGDEVRATSFAFSPFNAKETSNSLYSGRTPDTGIALKNIDLAAISGNINNALEFLAENDIKGSGMTQYRILVSSSDPAETTHRFDINVKGETTTSGTQRTIEYIQYEFIADSEGNLDLAD